MSLDDLLNKAIADNMDESDFIECLKVNNIQLPSQVYHFGYVFERLNHYLVTVNIIDDETPFKNIDTILDILISKTKMCSEEREVLFKYAIYFSSSNNKLFDSIEVSKKADVFSDYLSYRYGKFVYSYGASVMTVEYAKEQIAEEVWSAFDNELIKKDNIDAAIAIFMMKYMEHGKSFVFQSFISAIDKGCLRIKIQDEKNTINQVLENPLASNNESGNKKRL